MLALTSAPIDIVCGYLHCDLQPVPEGYMLVLRPCKYFEIITYNGRAMVFPCTTQ